MSTQQPSFASDLFDKTAEFGTWKTKIVFWIAIAIALCLLFAGIRLYFSDQTNLVDVTGKIEKINNSTVTTTKDRNGNVNYTYNYNLTVSYLVAGEQETRTAKITVSSATQYNVDSPIELTYDKTKPESVSAKVLRNKTIALVMSGVGTIILLIAGIQYWLSKSFKLYAAAQGASTVVNVLSAPFRS
jgi:hypothetical protein